MKGIDAMTDQTGRNLQESRTWQRDDGDLKPVILEEISTPYGYSSARESRVTLFSRDTRQNQHADALKTTTDEMKLS